MPTNPPHEELLKRIEELEKQLQECQQAQAELGRSRDCLASITQGMHEGFIVIDTDYRIKKANDRFLDYSGRTREEVVGATCYKIPRMFKEPCPGRGRLCPARAVFDSGAPIRVEHDRVGCGNQQLTFEIHAFPLFGQDGTVEHVAEVYHDITDRRRAEHEKMRREKLEAVLETAGAVRHELNQPMQALMYCEHMLMNISKDHPLYRPLQQIIENIDCMAEITRKLSYVERHETKDYIKGTKIIDIDWS